jgi:hypothetical protein
MTKQCLCLSVAVDAATRYHALLSTSPTAAADETVDPLYHLRHHAVANLTLIPHTLACRHAGTRC